MSEHGNIAACREALEYVKDRMDGWWEYVEVSEKVESALAEPPRNCDVGTLTEQQQRFHSYCERMQHTNMACCGGCPIAPLRMRGVIGNSCELAWAQMPYNEKEE